MQSVVASCLLQPIPASSHIICTASLDSIEGRKTWVRATVKDRPDGVEYAAGKALFVIPKKHPLNTSVDGTAEEDRAHAAGKHEFVLQSTCWPPSLNGSRQHLLCAYVLFAGHASCMTLVCWP